MRGLNHGERAWLALDVSHIFGASKKDEKSIFQQNAPEIPEHLCSPVKIHHFPYFTSLNFQDVLKKYSEASNLHLPPRCCSNTATKRTPCTWNMFCIPPSLSPCGNGGPETHQIHQINEIYSSKLPIVASGPPSFSISSCFWDFQHLSA